MISSSLRLSRLTIIGTTLLLLTACATTQERMIENSMERETGGEADVNLDDDGTMQVTTSEGSFTTGGSLSKEWPEAVPVYAGATVQFSATTSSVSDRRNHAAMLVTTDPMEDVVAFYENELEEGGWNVEATANMGGNTVITAATDAYKLSLSTSGADGQTAIVIGIEEELD